MSTQHTPGPWFAVERYSGGLSVIDQRGFEHIDAKFLMPVFELCPDKLSFPHWSDSPGGSYLEISDEEQAANARLIAAAPDLFAAAHSAKLALDDMQHANDPREWWVQRDAALKLIDSAIAKVTGQ